MRTEPRRHDDHPSDSARSFVIPPPARFPGRTPGLRAPMHPSRLVRVGLTFGAALSLAIAIAIGHFWWSSLQTPAWWERAGVLPGDSPQRAQAVEHGISVALFEPDALHESRTVELRAVDANAWLTERLEAWLSSQGDDWPRRLSAPRVQFSSGRLRLGVALEPAREGGTGRVLSMSFIPYLDRRGALSLAHAETRVGEARLGGLAAEIVGLTTKPDGTTGTPLDELLAESEGVSLGAILRGSQPVLDPAEINLRDGRLVKLLRVGVVEGGLRFTYAHTLRPTRTASASDTDL